MRPVRGPGREGARWPGTCTALGRWSFRHRFWVIGLWAALLVLGAVGATTLAGKTSDDFNLGNTESSRAFALIKDRTHAAADGATARIVVQAPPGKTLTDATARSAVTGALSRTRTGHVLSIADPYAVGTVSADGRTAYAVVRYDRIAPDLSSADKDALLQATTTLRDDGYTAVVGGDALSETAGPGSSEAIGIVIALMVLAITFGSLVAAGMPLLTAVIGVVHRHQPGSPRCPGSSTLSSTTPALASMLGLAVGIDYALFVMSRFKHEVATGKRPRGGRRHRHRHGGVGGHLRRPDRDHRAGRAVAGRHLLPHPDGARRGGDRGGRRPDRPHPAAGPAVPDRPTGRLGTHPRAQGPRHRGVRRRPHQRTPLGRAGVPVPGARARPRRAHRRRAVDPGHPHAAGPAGRRDPAGGQPDPPGLRPDLGELRRRHQRSAGRRRGHQGSARPERGGRCRRADRGGHLDRRRGRRAAGDRPERTTRRSRRTRLSWTTTASPRSP